MRGIRRRVILSATLLIILISPLATATSSDLTYVGASVSDSTSQRGNVVAISPDGAYLASGHNKALIIYNAMTMEPLLDLTLEKSVYQLSFSHDSTMLAFAQNYGSTQSESVQKIKLSTMTVMEGNARSSQVPLVLAWSIDDQTIAVEEENGGILYINSSDMSENRKMTTVHNTDLTCLEFSQDQNYFLSGDESGRYALWTAAGDLVGEYRQTTFGGGISDCGFSPNSSHIYLVVGSGELLITDIDGATVIKKVITGANQAKYSSDGDKIHLSTTGSSPKLITLRANTLAQETVTSFFHAAEDFAYVEDEYNRVIKVFVATRTGQLAIYLRDLIPEGIGGAGSDIDGDLLPDDIDTDDDGDGIPDEFDINCESSGPSCSQVSDLSLIRSISLTIDADTVTVTDHYVFPSQTSASIRNLSRKSIGDDLQISDDEVDLFSKSACDNMDVENRIDTWRSAISLSSGSLGEAVVICKVVDGLRLIAIDDIKTPIKLDISVIYIIKTEIDLPLTITIQAQPEPSDGAISWLAPQHPVAIVLNGDKGIGDELALWHVISGPVELSMSQRVIEDPTIIEVGVSWVLHPLSISFYLFLSLIGVLVWLRRSNAIDLSSVHIKDCQVCGAENPNDALNCNNCDALFAHEMVMEKLHGWMVENNYTVTELFNKFDEDGNGDLESDELLRGLRSLRIADLPVKQLRALIVSIDADGNGVIDLDEFQSAMADAEVSFERRQSEVQENFEDGYEEQSDWQEEVIDEPVRVRKKRVDSTGDDDRDVVKRIRAVKSKANTQPLVKKRAVKKNVSTGNKRTVKRRESTKSEEEMIDDALDKIL